MKMVEALRIKTLVAIRQAVDWKAQCRSQKFVRLREEIGRSCYMHLADTLGDGPLSSLIIIN